MEDFFCSLSSRSNEKLFPETTEAKIDNIIFDNLHGLVSSGWRKSAGKQLRVKKDVGNERVPAEFERKRKMAEQQRKRT
jgi:hypothetical protein